MAQLVVGLEEATARVGAGLWRQETDEQLEKAGGDGRADGQGEEVGGEGAGPHALASRATGPAPRPSRGGMPRADTHDASLATPVEISDRADLGSRATPPASSWSLTGVA